MLAVQLNQMEMTSAQTLHTEGLIKQGILLGKQKNLRQVISEISKWSSSRFVREVGLYELKISLKKIWTENATCQLADWRHRWSSSLLDWIKKVFGFVRSLRYHDKQEYMLTNSIFIPRWTIVHGKKTKSNNCTNIYQNTDGYNPVSMETTITIKKK